MISSEGKQHIVPSRMTANPVISIQQHLAPTAEYIKLLRELEQAAEDRIENIVRVKNTDFDCIIHTHKNFMDHSRTYKAIFSLGGKKMTVDYIAPDLEQWVTSIENLVEKISKTIAREMLVNAFTKDALI